MPLYKTYRDMQMKKNQPTAKFSSSPSTPWCSPSHQRLADSPVSRNWRQVWWKPWALLVAATETDRLLLGLLNLKQEQLEMLGLLRCLSQAAVLYAEQQDKASLFSLNYHTMLTRKHNKNQVACTLHCYVSLQRKRSFI